jgi:hypothetical protein
MKEKTDPKRKEMMEEKETRRKGEHTKKTKTQTKKQIQKKKRKKERKIAMEAIAEC